MQAGFDEYEQEQWRRIERWREAAPSVANRTFSRASGPVSRAVQDWLPERALGKALHWLHNAAERSANRRSILRQAGVADLAELRDGSLQRCDRLAVRAGRIGTVLSGGSGAVLGIAGGVGLTLDVPALLIIAFRTIHRVGLCYGEDCADQPQLVLGIFALASANTFEEKRHALEVLAQVDARDPQSLRDGVERTAERELAKEAMQIGLRRLSQQLAQRLGWRLGAAALPLVGAVVGGGVNAWFLQQAAVAAQRCFQQRWLQHKHGENGGHDKTQPEAALPPPQ